MFKKITIKVVFKMINSLEKMKLIKNKEQKKFYIIKGFDSFYKSFTWMKNLVLMMSSFIPLPGAAGGAEVSFFTFFKLFFPANLLNISGLLWRMITFYLTICIGMCFTLWQGETKNGNQYNEKSLNPKDLGF